MAKNNINVSLGVDLANLKKGFEDAIKITTGATKEAEAEAKAMASAINQQLGKIAGQSTMRGAIRQMENLAGQMSAFGLAGTKAFGEVIKQTGKLKAEQSDLKDLIESSRPDAPFKALQNGLQGAANAFAGVQGAMALFGAESEDTQKALLKVQAAMAFAQGFEAIDQLSDSFKQLNLIIKDNPIIAVAAGIMAAFAAYELLNKSVDKYAEVTEKANSKNQEELATMHQLQSAINSTVLSENDRNAAIDEAIKAAPEYLGNLSKHRNDLEYINKAISDYISLLGMQARAEATKSIYVEKLKEQLKAEADVKEMYRKGSTWAIGGPAAVENKASELKRETDELQKQYNIIANTVRLEQERLKSLNKVDKIEKSITTSTKAVEKAKLNFENTVKGQGLSQSTKPNVGGLFAGGPVMETQPRVLDKNSQAYIELAKSMKQVEINGKEMDAMIKGSLTETIIGMSEALGNGDNIGAAFLGGLAGFLKQFGKMLIAAAIAKLSFEKLITSIGGAPVAIAAGVAMVAAASAVQKHLQAGAQKFATGGIVGGSSFSGDKVPALVNSGEMILNKAQQSNLFSMINGGGGGYHVQLIPIIDNRGLAMQVEIGNKQRNRG